MILDKVLLDKLSVFSNNILKRYWIKEPATREDLCIFLDTLKKWLDEKEINSLFIWLILYNFVSSKEVRDRHTTARIFEDIFWKMVWVEPTDVETRINPPTTKIIEQYDKFCVNENWLVSTDLSWNKREKSDHKIKHYNLSIKTLKGILYDSDGAIIDKDFNDEINIGSLSYRSLFVGLINRTLSDRKWWLGSSKQLIPLLEEIDENGKFDEFKKRIRDYLDYVYEDDLLLVFKSWYKMKIQLIPREVFLLAISKSLEWNQWIYNFSRIWYRWENNNLRIKYSPLMKMIESLWLPYFSIILNLDKALNDDDFIDKIDEILESIDEKVDELL